MPGTIKDDKSAIAQTAGVELQRYRAQPKPAVKPQAKYFVSPFRRLLNAFADTHQFGRKLRIGGLAALLLVCLAVRVNAEFVNSDCAYPTCVNCRDASRFLDINRLVNSMYSGSPKQFMSSRHDGCGWFNSRSRHDNLKAGDYLDRYWYDYLDEGQYYYLDRTQYKLLGGANYILGHPCYPKLFERGSEHAVGFANRRRIYIPWYDCCWDYLAACKPASLGNVCTRYNGIPIDNYVIWHSCFTPGDHIEKLRYNYLDKGRYYILDETQYKWIGGLAYEFETPYSGIWHTYGSLYSSDFYFLLRDSRKEIITANMSSIPEPATIGLLGLGTLGLLIFRNKRKSKK